MGTKVAPPGQYPCSGHWTQLTLESNVKKSLGHTLHPFWSFSSSSPTEHCRIRKVVLTDFKFRERKLRSCVPLLSNPISAEKFAMPFSACTMVSPATDLDSACTVLSANNPHTSSEITPHHRNPPFYLNSNHSAGIYASNRAHCRAQNVQTLPKEVGSRQKWSPQTPSHQQKNSQCLLTFDLSI